MRGERDRIAGVIQPFNQLQIILRLAVSRTVKAYRLPGKREVIGKGRAGRKQRRFLAAQNRCGGAGETRAPTHNIYDRTSTHVQRRGPYRRLYGIQDRTVNRSEGLAGIVNMTCVQIRHAITVNIQSGLDDPHKLHQIYDRLANAIAQTDGQRRQDLAAFGGADRAIAIQIDAAAAQGDVWCCCRLSVNTRLLCGP